VPDEDEDNIDDYLREEEERLNQQEMNEKGLYTSVERWEEDLFGGLEDEDEDNIEQYLQVEEGRLEKSELHGKHRYGDMEYWDDRYGTLFKDPFDWLFTYEDIELVMHHFVKPEDLIMVTGCGNAPFSRRAYEAGYTNQINTDYSEKVIRDMLQVHRDLPELRYICMDALDLDLADESVDVIIDKGVYDTIVCYDKKVKAVLKMVYEAHRVLRPGGRYIILSLHPPGDAMDFVTKQPGLHWVTHSMRLPNKRGEQHSVVICRKMPQGVTIPPMYCNRPSDLPTFCLREKLKKKVLEKSRERREAVRGRGRRIGSSSRRYDGESGESMGALVAALDRGLVEAEKACKERLIFV
jgi:SAM-dependent methyltransferase